MVFSRSRRAAGRSLMAGALFAGVPAVTLAAAHPAAATALLASVQSAVSCVTASACVSGANTSSGPGVSGTSAKGYGVIGTTAKNATSDATGSYGVYGYDRSTNKQNVYNSGVYGLSSAGYGVQGYSVSNVGVYGHASTGFGVYGVGTGPGVYGVSAGNDGTGGYTSYVNAAGVSGTSDAGEGGYFESSATTGIQVINSNTKNPKTSTAITATTNGDSADLYNSTRAVLGVNAHGDGGEFAGSYIGLLGRAPTTGYPLDLVDENYKSLFLVDGFGNAAVAGNLKVAGAVTSAMSRPDGSRVSAFLAKTAAPTLEDTGTAQLSAGAAAVRLDPTFAASIDARQSYRVFVTPDGDTNGLYVAAKTASGFVVREIHGGRSTLAFDYRIVATAWGESGKRAAVMNGSTMATVRVLPVSIPNGRAEVRLKTPSLP